MTSGKHGFFGKYIYVKRLIIVSEMTKSLRGHYRRFGERTIEEISLQTFPKNSQWRRQRDVLWGQSVPQSGSGDRYTARLPLVERRVRQTTSDDAEAERRRRRASSADDWWNSSARYGGAVRCRHMYTRTASLNLIRSGTFSQWGGASWYCYQ